MDEISMMIGVSMFCLFMAFVSATFGDYVFAGLGVLMSVGAFAMALAHARGRQ